MIHVQLIIQAHINTLAATVFRILRQMLQCMGRIPLGFIGVWVIFNMQKVAWQHATKCCTVATNCCKFFQYYIFTFRYDIVISALNVSQYRNPSECMDDTYFNFLFCNVVCYLSFTQDASCAPARPFYVRIAKLVDNPSSFACI